MCPEDDIAWDRAWEIDWVPLELFETILDYDPEEMNP